MSYLINNQQKLNDIIFAGRNKNYGAYAIRSSYGNTLLKSLTIMISGFGALALTAYFLCRTTETADISGQILPMIEKITPVNVPHDNTEKKTAAATPIEKPAATPPTSHNSMGTTVVDSVASVNSPTAETAPANTHSVAVSDAGTGAPSTYSGSAGTLSATTTASTEVLDPNGVDEFPEFEGGLGALSRFVALNMRYPTAAYEAGHEGSVYVKFVVDERGKVGSLKLLNNAGFGLDEEALRVIGLIPNFKKPAKVNGHPVKMYYQLPIKFRLR